MGKAGSEASGIRGSAWAHRFAVLTAVTGFLLVVAGGLVTSTDSGLSVPDWPLSYGSLFPPMVGGIRFEHSHRMLAATVGALTLLLTLWLLVREKRRWVRSLGIFAFGLVVLQGILGGITVLMGLPRPVSIAHACLGPTFFATIVLLAQVLSPNWKSRSVSDTGPSFKKSTRYQMLFLTTTVIVFLQLLFGAILRHTGSCLDLHLLGAAALVGCALLLVREGIKNSSGEKEAFLVAGLIFLQLILGSLSLLFPQAVLIPTAHVAVGALTLASSTLLTARLFQMQNGIRRQTANAKSVSDTRSRPLAYLELTKPRLTSFALITSLAGFFLGSTISPGWGKLFFTLLGTALVGGGAGVLNQYLEREMDSQMQRTRRRPIPSGRVAPESALIFGVLLSVVGLITLTLRVNPLAGVLAVATLSIYLFLYTPLKCRTPLCTLVGAIPGAIPPLIGWAAARGQLDLEAWGIFAILFLWQLPHFLAIAWEYREDYSKAGFRMLPVIDPEGHLIGRQITLYLLALVPVSLSPFSLGLSGWIYFLGALVMSLAFLSFGLRAARVRSGESVHRLFVASLFYLPLLLMTMTLDKVIS